MREGGGEINNHLVIEFRTDDITCTQKPRDGTSILKAKDPDRLYRLLIRTVTEYFYSM
jgi:hypothetical protein